MKIIKFLFVSALFVFVVGNACATNYPSSRIKRYATNTPRAVEHKVQTLTKHLIRPLDDDYDKAMMIAYWIASHINYDKYLYNEDGITKLTQKHKQQSPAELLKSQVGICSEFSALFDTMCRIAGIKSEIVIGYVYPAKRKLKAKDKKYTAHAWNYFLYKGKKIYVDTTFMAGGSTAPRRRVTEISHKRALRDVVNDNRYKSKINDFDEYYFDFVYKDEIKTRRIKREER